MGDFRYFFDGFPVKSCIPWFKSREFHPDSLAAISAFSVERI